MIGCVERETTRVNQAEIAKALGLSQSTVSIGLKGDTRVARKTREAIERKAEELGYVPDPQLRALSQYRSQSRERQIVAEIAWMTNFPTKDGWKSKMCLAYRRGASRRAAELGYQLYDFWLADPDISHKRLKQILLARGIRGLLLAPQAHFRTKLEFDLSGLAAVTFGYSLQSPALHVVTNYQHHSVRLAYRSLMNLGYKRIGMLLNDGVDRRVDRNFSGGYHSMNPSGMDADFIQPHLFEIFDVADFEKWFNRWKPDAVIVTGGSSEQLQEWLDKKGLKAGTDLAYAELNLSRDDGSIAGVNQQQELTGRAAVNVLDSLLTQFEYGIPENPLQTLVEGVWMDGESAPPKTS